MNTTRLINYTKFGDIFAEYKASRYDEEFFREHHRQILTMHRAANNYFEEYKKAPLNSNEKSLLSTKIKNHNAKYVETLARKKQNYTKYRRMREDAKCYLTTENIFDVMLWLDNESKQQETLEPKESELNKDR